MFILRGVYYKVVFLQGFLLKGIQLQSMFMIGVGYYKGCILYGQRLILLSLIGNIYLRGVSIWFLIVGSVFCSRDLLKKVFIIGSVQRKSTKAVSFIGGFFFRGYYKRVCVYQRLYILGVAYGAVGARRRGTERAASAL